MADEIAPLRNHGSRRSIGLKSPGSQPYLDRIQQEGNRIAGTLFWRTDPPPRYPANPDILSKAFITLRLPILSKGRHSRAMYEFPLTGAQKAFLRSRGQTLDAVLKVGRGGLTPAFFTELQRLLRSHELVKLRFLGADRAERAALCDQIADQGRCLCIAAVGSTALFFRQNPEPKERRVDFGGKEK